MSYLYQSRPDRRPLHGAILLASLMGVIGTPFSARADVVPPASKLQAIESLVQKGGMSMTSRGQVPPGAQPSAPQQVSNTQVIPQMPQMGQMPQMPSTANMPQVTQSMAAVQALVQTLLHPAGPPSASAASSAAPVASVPASLPQGRDSERFGSRAPNTASQSAAPSAPVIPYPRHLQAQAAPTIPYNGAQGGRNEVRRSAPAMAQQANAIPYPALLRRN
jgi:hypothetical protein